MSVRLWSTPVVYGPLAALALFVKSRRYRSNLLKDFRVFHVLDNQERLAFFGLESLELRRLKADLCMTYKIMFNLVNFNVDNFFAVRTNKITRGHPYTLVIPLCQVRVRSNFCACRVVDPLNNLDAFNSFQTLFSHLMSFKMFSVVK